MCNINNNITYRIFKAAVQQEGLATANYYRAYIETKDIQPSEVNMENLKEILGSIPLEDKSHYYVYNHTK